DIHGSATGKKNQAASPSPPYATGHYGYRRAAAVDRLSVFEAYLCPAHRRCRRCDRGFGEQPFGARQREGTVRREREGGRSGGRSTGRGGQEQRNQESGIRPRSLSFSRPREGTGRCST